MGCKIDGVQLSYDEHLEVLASRDGARLDLTNGSLVMLEGVPVKVHEPLTLARLREVRDLLLRQSIAIPRQEDWLNDLIVFGVAFDPCPLPAAPQTCRQCGQATEHFFTSQRDQSVLCEACFGERETKQLAKQVQGGVDGDTHASGSGLDSETKRLNAMRTVSVAGNKRETPMARRREAATASVALDVDRDPTVMDRSCQQRALELARRSEAGSIPAPAHKQVTKSKHPLDAWMGA